MLGTAISGKESSAPILRYFLYLGTVVVQPGQWRVVG